MKLTRRSPVAVLQAQSIQLLSSVEFFLAANELPRSRPVLQLHATLKRTLRKLEEKPGAFAKPVS
jgi:hypothetical protein